MSGIILPLPEPPAEDADELLLLLRAARLYHDQAEKAADQLLRDLAEDAGGRPLRGTLAMAYRIELTAAQYRMQVWESMVGVLEHRARAMGLEP